jgi:hypothetical protein
MNSRVPKENLITEIYKFFRHLNYSVTPSSLSFQSKVANVSKLISWLYLILIPVGIIINIVLTTLDYKGSNDVETLINEAPLWFVVVLGAIIAPALEETIFRLSLRFRPIYFSLSTAVICFYFSGTIFRNIEETLQSFFLLRIILPLFIGGLMYILIKFTPLNSLLSKMYKRFFAVIFYISAIVFGLIHISNYTERGTVLFMLPLLVLPQIIVGFVLGYVRIKYGFRYSYLLHAIFNGALILPSSLVLTMDGKNPLVILIIGASVLLVLGFGLLTLLVDIVRIFISRAKYV